jgi:hypothetical protein
MAPQNRVNRWQGVIRHIFHRIVQGNGRDLVAADVRIDSQSSLVHTSQWQQQRQPCSRSTLLELVDMLDLEGGMPRQLPVMSKVEARRGKSKRSGTAGQMLPPVFGSIVQVSSARFPESEKAEESFTETGASQRPASSRIGNANCRSLPRRRATVVPAVFLPTPKDKDN